MQNNQSIGVFDSGVGGLTVLKELSKVLPNENYIYFGDTARVPYGEKSQEQLVSYSREIISWFETLNVKAVLMACNTSSANTLNVVKEEFKTPVLGLIEPTATGISLIEEKKIGVIATTATVNSKAYSDAISKLSPEKECLEVACNGLVQIIENNKINSDEAKELVGKYLTPLKKFGAEKIVLGCTHYPYLSSLITEIYKKENLLINPAEFMVNEAKLVLEKKSLIGNSTKPEIKYFVSANPEQFISVGSVFNQELKSVGIKRF